MDEERLVEDLKFKEMCKLQVFKTAVDDPIPSERYNLLVACNKYGYLYVGYDKGIKMLKTSELTQLNSKADKSKETVTDYPHVAVELGCMPHHLALSADSITLSVCYRKDTSLILALYDVRTLLRSGATATAISTKVISQGSDIWVMDLCWNPQNLAVTAACLSDGSLLLCETSAGVKVVANMQKDSDAKAICWSPKGKQLVVGKGDGSLVQYDLQLNEKRRIQKPYTFDDRVIVVDVCWLSTYKFIAAYADTDGRLQPNIVTVSAPKDGDPMFINYEDICMGDGDRQGQYYLKYIDKWDILLAMQSNGAEMGLMGKQPNNPNQWEIWNVNDNARLTLPLNVNNEETFPLGIALDTTSELVHAGGRASPIVITLSTEGKLCPFYMIYEAECQVITSPPEALPPGQRQSVDTGGGDAVVPSIPAPAAPQPSGPVVFGGGKAPGPTSVPGDASSLSAFSFSKPSSTAAIQPSGASSAAPAFSLTTSAAATSSTGFSFGAKTNLPSFGQSPNSAGAGFSFSQKSAPTPAQPQAPGTTGFSFASNTTPAFGQPAAAPGGFSFASKTTTPSLPFGQSSTPGGGSSFSFTPTPQPSSGGLFSSQTAFTPSGSQPQKVVTPGATSQALAQPATVGQSAFSLSSSSSSFSAPKVAADLPKPQAHPQPVSAFSQPVSKPFTSATSSGFSPAGSSLGHQPPMSHLLKSAVPVSSPAQSAVGQPFGGTGSMQFGSQPKPPASVNIIKPVAGVPSTGAQEAKVLHQPKAQEHQAKMPTMPTQETTPYVTNPSMVHGASAVAAPLAQGSPSSEKLQSAFSAKIKEEMELFSRELKSLRQRANAGSYVIGTDDEKKLLRASIDKLTEFRQESVEVTKSINEDIHHLKSDTLNAFSLIEEAKLREHRNNDPRYVYFLKARSLDPATLKKLQEIRSKQHNLESGLKDVNACLDATWDEQQFSRGRKKRVMKPPTLDAVYQTLSNHHNIISSLGEQLKVVKQRLREAQCYDISAWPSPTTPSATGIQDVDMSSVTKSMSRSRISDAVVHTPISAKKRSQIKDLMSQRSSTPIRSAKKGNMSQMIQFSNSRRLVEDVEHIAAKPLNLAKELELEAVDGNAASQPRLPAPVAKVEVERKQQQPARSVAIMEEPPKPKPKSAPPPTSPVVKTSGKKTVKWGASTKLTPSQAAGVAAVNRLNSQQMAEAVMISQSTPAQKDLPPVVNIGKLESMKEAMPPPVTFAPVGSSVNAGTAKVLNDVIAEMAMASGKTTQQFTRGPKSPAAQLSPTTLPKSLENLAKPQPTSVAAVGPHPNISAPIASAKAFTIKPDASAFSLTSPAAGQVSTKTPFAQPLKQTTSSQFSESGRKAVTTTSPSLPAASPVSSGFGGFNSASSTSASFSSGFSFTSKGASAPQAGFSFGGAAAVASSQVSATTPTPDAGSQSGGFSFVKPRVTAASSATASPSVTSTTPGSLSGFSFGASGVAASTSTTTASPAVTSFSFGATVPSSSLSSGFPTSTSTTTTSPAVTSFSFGATVPSSSSSAPFGFSFSKPSSTGPSETSPFTFASKPSTPASSTSPSSEEPPAVAPVSTGKTSSAVGSLDLATGGSAMPVSVKGQELHFPHQESSPTQVTDTKDEVQKTIVASADPKVTPVVKPAGGFGFSSTGAFGATPTPGIEKAQTTQSLLATPAAVTPAAVTQSSNKNLMGLLASDDEPAASSATSTATGSATAGFSFRKPPDSTVSSATTAAASTTSFSFGQTAPSTSSAGGFSFGGTSATTSAAAPTSTTSGSLFGQTSSAFGSIAFGSKPGASGAAGSSFTSGSLFGKKPEESGSTTGLAFGGSTTAGTDDCGTGKPAPSGFSFSSASDASKNPSFGQAAAPASAFGQAAAPASAFGQATAPASAFGQAAAPTSAFGQTAAPTSAFGQTPSFGSTPQSAGGSSIFGGGGGGGMFSGLGGKPSAEAAKVNPFGVSKSDTASTFGGTSLFGNQKGKTFGGTDEAGAFGTQGSFSSNTGGFAFGQAASPVKTASGFGSPPSFGGSSGFGNTAFGSTPAFSSPIGASAFGAGNTAAAGGFSAFANNDTPGFGNLANQGGASFASMGGNQPSAFGAGFGQQTQASMFGGASTFGGAATTSPFGGGGTSEQAFGSGGSPFGNTTSPAKSPSFSGWR